MRDTIWFGVAGVALAASALAWAGERSSDEKGVRGSSRATVQARASASAQRPSSATVVVSSYRSMDARTARGSPEVRPFSQARWLQEREGYRDGGY